MVHEPIREASASGTRTQGMGKVAVITGAGSGIGYELALACARRGIAIVAADLDLAALAQTRAMVEEYNVPCVTTRCDVTKADEVEQLAELSWNEFDGVDWLFNNAGVAVLGPGWHSTTDDWSWVLGVNLMGVANGVASFTPRMLASGMPAHIINTSSAAGLVTLAGSAVYCASKHAVVAFSECLLADFKAAGAPIGVSVLCPALVQTGINQSARNRPADLANSAAPAASYEERVRIGMAASPITASDVAERTIEGVEANRFYVMPHDQTLTSIESRYKRMIDDFKAARKKPPKS